VSVARVYDLTIEKAAALQSGDRQRAAELSSQIAELLSAPAHAAQERRDPQKTRSLLQRVSKGPERRVPTKRQIKDLGECAKQLGCKLEYKRGFNGFSLEYGGQTSQGNMREVVNRLEGIERLKQISIRELRRKEDTHRFLIGNGIKEIADAAAEFESFDLDALDRDDDWKELQNLGETAKDLPIKYSEWADVMTTLVGKIKSARSAPTIEQRADVRLDKAYDRVNRAVIGLAKGLRLRKRSQEEIFISIMHEALTSVYEGSEEVFDEDRDSENKQYCLELAIQDIAGKYNVFEENGHESEFSYEVVDRVDDLMWAFGFTGDAKVDWTIDVITEAVQRVQNDLDSHESNASAVVRLRDAIFKTGSTRLLSEASSVLYNTLYDITSLRIEDDILEEWPEESWSGRISGMENIWSLPNLLRGIVKDATAA
jgi:hypothetical protein